MARRNIDRARTRIRSLSGPLFRRGKFISERAESPFTFVFHLTLPQIARRKWDREGLRVVRMALCSSFISAGASVAVVENSLAVLRGLETWLIFHDWFGKNLLLLYPRIW